MRVARILITIKDVSQKVVASVRHGEENMAMTIRRLAVTVLVFWGALAWADDAVDVDLRRAAILHRQGDTAGALAIWRHWAQEGDVDAAYNLGLVYQHADGVGHDPAEALRWYRLAAERGDKPAQFQIGLMYQNGEGVPADQAQAHAWFTKNRRDHIHHHHTPQFQQWQKQARVLIEERDRRESAQAARRDGERILAELHQRAGLTSPAAPLQLVDSGPASN